MTMLKWTVEFSLDSSWVSDGFRLTDDLARDMLATALPHAYSHEMDAKVVASPTPSEIEQCENEEVES